MIQENGLIKTKYMKTVIMIQARMGSTRLPDKVMKKIVGIPAIEIILKRLKRSKEAD